MTKTKPTFKRTKAITLPTLKTVIDASIFVTIKGIHFSESKEKDAETGEFKKVPVARVINLEDGEQYEVVLGSTLISQLQDNYPEDTVNGKSFEITKHGKKTGKRYHTYTVYEIEAPTPS